MSFCVDVVFKNSECLRGCLPARRNSYGGSPHAVYEYVSAYTKKPEPQNLSRAARVSHNTAGYQAKPRTYAVFYLT